MLEDTVQGWLEEGRAQGVAQGRVQGIRQGRSDQRALLCRVAARKFDGETAERLAVALTDVVDPDDLAEVGEWIVECPTAAALDARLAERLPTKTLAPLGQLKQTYVMLEEIIQEWVAHGRARGIEQGRAQAIEQGRSDERALLCRLAARKFDDDTAGRLAATLAGVTDPDRLAEVGEWIIECATAADLIARVSVSGPPRD